MGASVARPSRIAPMRSATAARPPAPYPATGGLREVATLLDQGAVGAARQHDEIVAETQLDRRVEPAQGEPAAVAASGQRVRVRDRPDRAAREADRHRRDVLDREPGVADRTGHRRDLDDRLARQPQQGVDVVDAEPAQDAAAARHGVEQRVRRVADRDRRRREHGLGSDEAAEVAARDERPRRPRRRGVAPGQPDDAPDARGLDGCGGVAELTGRSGRRLVDQQVDPRGRQAGDGGGSGGVRQGDEGDVEVVPVDQVVEVGLEWDVAISARRAQDRSDGSWCGGASVRPRSGSGS